MATRQRKQSKVRPLLVPGICLLLLGYFGYHAIEGQYGHHALQTLKARKGELAVELAELEAERATLDHRVSLMRPQSLDPDLIEERARLALDVARDGEIVILRANYR